MTDHEDKLKGTQQPSQEYGRPTLTGGIRWRQTFAALRYRNYRLWFWGQMTSLFGSWMQTTAQGFLVFELTRSPMYLGYVGFATGIPAWLFTLYGGVIADRISRRSLLIVTQSSMMILAFILAGLTFLNIVQPWHIVLLACLLGVANAFDAPARQAFVSEMVKQEDLTNAIALNSTMFHSATAVGPAVAGFAYALFGPGWCFTINGVSFIAVIVALALMKLKQQPARVERPSALAELKEGLLYALHEPTIRTLISLVAVVSMFGISLGTLLPAWAVTILGGHAATNGLLFAARGVGSLSGALLIASLGRFSFRGKLLTLGTFAFPVFLFIFAFLRWLPLSILVLIGAGASTILVMNLANALVQTLSPDFLRGRVMGLYSLVFFGFMPLGALWTGFVAGHIGEPESVIINSVIAFAFSFLVWAAVPQLREK